MVKLPISKYAGPEDDYYGPDDDYNVPGDFIERIREEL